MAKIKKPEQTTTEAPQETPKRTKCPVTKDQFIQQARPILVKVGDQQMVAKIKKFSTGSFGWYVNGKLPILVGEVPVNVQVCLTLTAVGSKEVG